MEEKKCSGTCADKQQTCIPFFVAENQVMHMDKTNKRMLLALLAVCITFILTIIIFVRGYTIREKNCWTRWPRCTLRRWPMYKNSQAREAIEEWAHDQRDRQILFDRLIDGLTFERLAEKHDMSERKVRRIVKRLEKEVFSHME